MVDWESSSPHLLHDVAFLDTGEAEIEIGMAERELLVIEAHEVQDGGVEIVDVDRFINSCR